jgi:hypothetical protein
MSLNTRCGYEVPGSILLQTLCLYTYRLMREVTFKELPLSSYALSPTMLPLLETFLGLLLWNNFQCRRHIFWLSSVSSDLRPFKADFIFGDSQKSFRVKYGERGRCSISVIDFCARNCFTESKLFARSTVMVENSKVGPKFRPFSIRSFT